MKTLKRDDQFDGDAGIIFRLKQETFETHLRNCPLLILAENDDGSFTVHRWSKESVFSAHDYATARLAAARMLQLLGTGPVAPQTFPEQTCIGVVGTADGPKDAATVFDPDQHKG
jgi:hypothetical protein